MRLTNSTERKAGFLNPPDRYTSPELVSIIVIRHAGGLNAHLVPGGARSSTFVMFMLLLVVYA